LAHHQDQRQADEESRKRGGLDGGCGEALGASVLRYIMPWTRKFPEPIVLKDGRVIVTLNDARVVMRSLPARSQSSDAWFYAGGLMLEAATADGPIGETVAQLRRALRADGLL
jgi:hypothetical protein